MKKIHYKNNYLSKENFNFLKEFLCEKKIINTKEISNEYDLYDEIMLERVRHPSVEG